MSNQSLLKEGLKSLNLEHSDRIISDFWMFKDLLLEWNEKINLTAITEEHDIVTKHFLDSVTCLTSEVDFDNKSVLDVGTGGGFPGVPLKIMNRSIEMTLLDSLNKRINYLKIVGENLKFDRIHYLHSRAEDAAANKQYRENFDIVVSRAVANMSTLTEYCLPFVKLGGYFIAQKTMGAENEIKEAEKAIKILGGEIVRIVPVTVPNTELSHNLVIIKKIMKTPATYPRKAGIPSKNPLK